jgi:hypothetical protein
VSVARQHAEWLSLMESSGPFVSLPVLMRVFPQGLDRRDPAKAARLREGYEEWLERGSTDSAVHRSWIRFVLQETLEYPDSLLVEGQAIPPGLDAPMPTFFETLRADFVLKHREPGKRPLLLISIYPPSQELDQPVAGKFWKANAGTRLMELLHTADVPIGLATNGEQWMLVSARRKETTGFASWYADLWMQEPLTLRSFHSLLHLRRLTGVAEPETLPALLVESGKDQQEVTDQLGYQVRQAVEVLIQEFDRIDAESGRTLLAHISEKTLYDSALTVMMRLVFLFSAEERGLLLLGDPLYDQNYAVSTLSESLRERADQHGEEVLERRHDAWCRLLSTFRAVHYGVQHEAMRLPAYGGSLFEPSRFPFLEGQLPETSFSQTERAPLLISNRVVLHLLEALQMLRVKVPGGGPDEARRLSFRALDIEQIGHVYEGLLDHTATRAIEPMLGLEGANDKQPEISLSAVETMARDSRALVEFVSDQTGRSKRAIERVLQELPQVDPDSVSVACGHDETLRRRVLPFAALLRKDSFGRLVVIRAGALYVTSGTDRRSTGTHYTPRPLAETIVKHTLSPLTYVGPERALPESEWLLKTPREILDLKVCDMAMGSGAFLVAVCRYLAERLVESWENAEREHPGSFVATPDGELSTGDSTERLIPSEPAERIAIARRYVADRCLYGLDINPMAVEMAKLSLWLVTLQRDRPFGFIDHALKHGDSLLGVTSMEQIANFSLRSAPAQQAFAAADLAIQLQQASDTRRVLEALPSSSGEQIHVKTRLYLEAEAGTKQIKALGDLLIALELKGFEGNTYDLQRAAALGRAQDESESSLAGLESLAKQQIGDRRPFHWPVEFAEVFANGGFDAFVGNPPFIGGTRLEPLLGADYREFLVKHIAAGRRGIRGAADLCCYFFLRIGALCKKPGYFGLIATNTIVQGDSRVVGLDALLGDELHLYRAYSSLPWPGNPATKVSLLWMARGESELPCVLDDVDVPSIGSDLSVGATEAITHLLESTTDIAFEGAKTAGIGFILSDREARELLAIDSMNRDVVHPYLVGNDVNSHPSQRPSRWIINFRDMPLERGPGLAGPSASDYPSCLRIVEERVKPERFALDDRNSWNRGLKARWWQFGLWRPAMARALTNLSRALVSSRVTAHHCFSFVSTDMVFSDRLVVIARADWETFTLISSSIHGEWAHRPGSTTQGATPNYLPTWAFRTFCVPASLSSLGPCGESYHEFRRDVMLARNEGLTTIYNRFHDPKEHSEDITRLRVLHTEMDYAVAGAYDWNDFDLGHGFRITRHGVRFSLSEPALRRVMERLVALNHRRHTEETAEVGSSMVPRKRKSRRQKSPSKPHPELFR